MPWVSGTRLGRDVVPLVCNTRATSSADGGSSDEELAAAGPEKFISPRPPMATVMCKVPLGAAFTASSPPVGPVMMARALVSSR